MRISVVFILFLLLWGQQTTVNGQQTFSETENLRTVESENSLANDKSLKAKGNVQKFSDSQVFNFSDSKKSSQVLSSSDSQVLSFSDSQVLSSSDSQVLSSSDSQVISSSDSQVLSFSDSQVLSSSDSQVISSSDSQVFSSSDSQVLSSSDSQVLSFSASQVLHHENQIRLADSLYKNYLPQSNFEEVKAAMEFFDSYQPSAISGQRWRLFSKEADEENRLIAESRQLTAAKAHYYHAVGLTERDDIVGACEHYLIALEIMETELETENLKTSKSEKVLKIFQVFNFSDSQFLSFSDSQILNNPEDYEKIRFLALTYTRLGRLFYNENYCDLAILKYRKALEYIEYLGNNEYKANILKELGNVYQLNGESDSALCYYNSSLKANPDLTNKLDLEKNIAQILFDKGEKDSAYIMITNNINKIDNINVRYSYYNTLGEMYVEYKEYDSAIYYLTKSISSNISNIKVNSAIKLSAIYDSIGDNTKKAYYDDIVSKISISDINKNIETNKLQDVYDRYKERKIEKEKIKSRTRTKVIAISLSLLIIISFVIIILIWYKSKRKDRLHQESLKEKDRYIANKEEIISKTNEEVKQKESEIKNLVEIIDGHKSDVNSLKNELSIKEHEISCKETDIRKMENDLSAKEMELEKLQKNVHENSILIDRLSENHKTNEELMIAYIEEIEKLKTEIDETRHNLNDIKFRSSLIEGKIKSKNTELQKKEEEINRYKLELSEYKNKLEIISSDNNDNAYTPKIGMDLYLQSKVCSKILNEINELSARNRDANILTPLKQEELVMLLNSASFYVNNFTNGIACKYSKLKKEDLYYLSLALIGLKDKQISSLLGVTYNSIRIRKKNLCSILGIKNDELQSFLMNICN